MRGLDALASYVNYALPLPVPPSTLDPAQVARGQAVFQGSGCPLCHSGAAFTDLGGTLANPRLHDVGTWGPSGPFPDVATPDEDGDPRDAGFFDTPTLRGVSASAPCLHDGRAATLLDVFTDAPAMGSTASLSDDDKAALVAYLRSL